MSIEFWQMKMVLKLWQNLLKLERTKTVRLQCVQDALEFKLGVI